MLYIKNLEDGIELFKVLGSEVRVNIIKLLLQNREMNMNEIANSLNITNGALTSHIKRLEDAGLILVAGDAAGHGNQKVCSVKQERILVDIVPESGDSQTGSYEAEVPVGQYASYSVFPTCGISTVEHLIGEVDDPRYFAHPDRIQAGVLWFSRGYVEYLIPNVLPAAQKIDELMFTMEISSEAPGTNNDWPSDITFSLNDVPIGVWTSPGDFGDARGTFTPDWWLPNWNQYGLLKMLVINREGTFIDGLKISDVSLEQFRLDYRSLIRLRMEVREDAAHVGGMTLFGSGFGNYSQGIKVRIRYSKMAG
ncbi:MAG: winged helix-turn-helix transcriptional regulator [Eubacteriales bacterium]|nr:winged helix-turn-helix transcriptional regulator [Eubacteriales bacterium]